VDDAARLLAETELFAGIDPVAVAELAQRTVRRTFRRGQPLFHQGDPGDALYVLVDGCVAVVVTSEAGERMVLTTMCPPGVIGEIALLDGGVRSASAEAVEETTTLVLSRAAFLESMREHPPLVDELLHSLGRLVRRLSEQASDFVFLDLSGRVAKVLLRLADDSVPPEVAVTQARLAEMVGGTRQSVNEILHAFAARGMVELVGRGGVLICDDEGLRRRARIL
jgi:CRP-like cAMP-binding protein